MIAAPCYAEHEAIKRDPARWAALDYVGRWELPADETGPLEVLELRNCPGCHSTLAVEVAAEVRP